MSNFGVEMVKIISEMGKHLTEARDTGSVYFKNLLDPMSRALLRGYWMYSDFSDFLFLL